MIRYRFLFYSLYVSAVTIAAYYFGLSFDWRTNDATQTVKAYLQKTYARDFKNAYQYLSIADRQSRGEASYVESQGAYSGFALEAVTKLANFMEVCRWNKVEAMVAGGSRLATEFPRQRISPICS